MPRRVAKASRSERTPAANTVTVVSGSIRPLDDETALAVKLSIWDTEVTMRANGVELGNWPSEAVNIRALDASSFEFVAEGDQLIFTPDDPEEFARLPQVSTPMLGSGRKKSRKSKEPKKPPAKVELAWHEDSVEEKRRLGMRPKRDSEPKAQKMSRRERKAQAVSAASAQESLAEPVPTPSDPLPVIEPAHTEVIPQELDLPDPFAESQPESPKVKPATNGSVDPSHSSGDDMGRLHRARIFAIDQARKYDLMGLDRVPVDESQRGKDHEHTWNHRVARSSGLGSRICTVCGEIRRSR